MVAAVTVAVAQDPRESETALSGAREKIDATAHRLPRYTCLETINRDYFALPATAVRGKVMSAYSAPSCSSIRPLSQPASDLVLTSSDRLRLEVAIADNREVYSWPHATRFDSRDLDDIVGFGPTSTGSFGGYLVEVFENPDAKIEFAGTKMAAGERIFEYQFRIPVESSHYYVKASGGRQPTASSGSFDIAATLTTQDLTQIVIQTEQLPEGAGMCQAKTTVDYQQLRIGDGDFLIPLKSEYETSQIDSSRTASVNTFSACHEYTAESTISFDDNSPAAADPGRSQVKAAAIPAGLPVELKLTASIDTGTAAAGDVVFATVSKAVAVPGSKAILIPNGARVRGRISEMRHFIKPSPNFQIGLLFETVELEGRETPVTLSAQRESPRIAPVSSVGSVEAGYSSRSGLRMRPLDLNIPPPGTSGEGGVFAFTARIIPAGFESKWITRQRKP